MAPLVKNNLDDSMMTSDVSQIGRAFDGSGGILVLVSTVALTILFVQLIVLVVILCACGGKNEDQDAGKKEEAIPPPTTSATGGASGKAEPAPTGGSAKAPDVKSARSAQNTKIKLTPPGATCPPQYMPEDADATVNVKMP